MQMYWISRQKLNKEDSNPYVTSSMKCIDTVHMPVWNHSYQQVEINHERFRSLCSYNLFVKDRCMKSSCTKRRCFWGLDTDLLIKASRLTAFCAWDSSPHLLATPAQLMRPGIDRNVFCAMGDFACWHLGLFLGEMWFVDVGACSRRTFVQ